MDTPLKKLFNVLKYEGKVLNQTDFGAKMGYSKSHTSTILKYDKLTADVQKTVCKIYGVNPEWLETGSDNPDVPMFGEQRGSEKRSVPVITSDFKGVFKPASPVSETRIDVGEMLADSDAAFLVHEKSMDPTFPPGCLLGVRQNHDNFIQPGEAYLLLTKSSSVFRRLYPNSDQSGYICMSDNFSKHDDGPMAGQYHYPMFEVRSSDVVAIFDVTGMTRRSRNSSLLQRG